MVNEDDLIEALARIEKLEAELQRHREKYREDMFGGTEATEIGLKQRTMIAERTLKRVLGDGELERFLAVVDPHQIQAMLQRIAILENNMVKDCDSKIAGLLEFKNDSKKIQFWLFTSIGGAVLAAAAAAVIGYAN